jgi:hypothetical protein
MSCPFAIGVGETTNTDMDSKAADIQIEAAERLFDAGCLNEVRR